MGNASIPLHAVVSAATDDPSMLLVSCHDTLERSVCVVDLEGRQYHEPICCGAGRLSAEAGRSYDPEGLAVMSNPPCVLVTDSANDRIVVLGRSLDRARSLPLNLKKQGELREPVAVCVDESRGRLYVGENGGQRRVLVFKGVADVASLFDE